MSFSIRQLPPVQAAQPSPLGFNGVPIHSLPEGCHVERVVLPFSMPTLPSQQQQFQPMTPSIDYSQLDLMYSEIENVFMDRAFCLAPGIVCSTTVMVNEFADGRVSYGLMQTRPDEVKTMGYTFDPATLSQQPQHFAVTAHNAFLHMCQMAQVDSLPGMTLDTSLLPSGGNY